MKTITISPAVLQVLSLCTVEGQQVFLPPTQLDRKLYQQVNEVLEALGGKWNRKAKAHVFTDDPAERLDQAMLSGSVERLKTDKDAFSFFATPETLAREVAGRLDLEAGHKVLEPSAGLGALALAAAEVTGKENVHCIEIFEPRVLELQALGFSVDCQDFLQVIPEAVYDRIIMNPPFERQQDVDHVTHALKFLKPGGILAAIMSPGPTFRKDRKNQAFLDLLESLSGYRFINNPEGSFKGSGTGVHTITLVVRK